MVDEDRKSGIWPLSAGQWVGILLVVLAIVFIAQNRADVTFALLWISLTAPLWFVLTVMVVLGLAAGYLIGRRSHRRR